MKATMVIISGMIALSLASQSEHTKRITVPLSRPGEPGVLILQHHKGSINVTGYEGTSLVVTASLRFPSDATPTVDLGVAEKDNHVVLSAGPRHRTIDLEIMVPRQFSVQLKKDDSGTICVTHLSGEIEVSNLNGDIRLLDVAGSALLDTVDGDITAQFRGITPGAPMAFTSLEGNLDIALPNDVRASIRMRADRGQIHNEFAASPGSETSSEDDSPQAPWTCAQINGGGPEMRLRSFHGHVRLRPSENTSNAPPL